MTVYINIRKNFDRMTAQTEVNSSETIEQAIIALLTEMAFDHIEGKYWEDKWMEKKYILSPTDEDNIFNLDLI